VGEVLDLITGEGTSAKFRLEEIHPASTAALEGSAS
jgi:hypothetical protein